MEGIQGKVALVTGGGRGLGEQISRALAEAGAIGDRRRHPDRAGRRRSSTTSARQGRQAEAVRLDVTDEGSVQAAIAQMVEKYGKLDVIVNNAGTDVTLPVDELAIEDWDLVMAVNLRGPFLMAKYGFPHMQAAGQRPDRQHRVDRRQARLAQRLGLPREQVGPARAVATRCMPRAARTTSR